MLPLLNRDPAAVKEEFDSLHKQLNASSDEYERGGIIVRMYDIVEEIRHETQQLLDEVLSG